MLSLAYYRPYDFKFWVVFNDMPMSSQDLSNVGRICVVWNTTGERNVDVGVVIQFLLVKDVMLHVL